jgi:P-type conjugative transfer protein TrbJ
MIPRRPRPLVTAALAVLLLLGPVVSGPPPAEGQFAVFDGANLIENLKTAIQTYLAIVQRIEVILNQLRQLEAAYQNLLQLENPTTREIGWFLWELADLIRRTEGLVYSLEDLDEQVLALFPGYEPSEDLGEDYAVRTHAALETLRAALLSTQRTTRHFSLSLETLKTLTEQATDTEGALEALHANSILVGHTAQEVTALLQQVAMLTNAQAVYFSHTIETEAAAAASYEGWIAGGMRDPGPYDGAPGFSLVPADYPW